MMTWETRGQSALRCQATGSHRSDSSWTLSQQRSTPWKLRNFYDQRVPGNVDPDRRFGRKGSDMIGHQSTLKQVPEKKVLQTGLKPDGTGPLQTTCGFFGVWHRSDLHVGHDFRVHLEFTYHGVDLHLGYDGLQSCMS